MVPIQQYGVWLSGPRGAWDKTWIEMRFCWLADGARERFREQERQRCYNTWAGALDVWKQKQGNGADLARSGE